MSKLIRYESFEEMKADVKTNTVSADVLSERQQKFENFAFFLRGDDAKGTPPSKQKKDR